MKQKTSKIGASGGSAPNPMPATAKPAAAPEKVRVRVCNDTVSCRHLCRLVDLATRS